MGRYHENRFTHFSEGCYRSVLPQKNSPNLLSMSLLRLNKLDKVMSGDKLPFHTWSSLSLFFFCYFFLKKKKNYSENLNYFQRMESQKGNVLPCRSSVPQTSRYLSINVHPRLSPARTPQVQVTTSSLVVKWHHEKINKGLSMKKKKRNIIDNSSM